MERLKDEFTAKGKTARFDRLSASGQGGASALDMELCPGESRIRPRAGDRIRFNESELTWRTFQHENHVIDFFSALGHGIENSAAYAVCYINADADQRDLRLLIGSDDQSKVYLNGREVYQSRFRRGFIADEDVVEGIALNAGENVLVFKVINMTSFWKGSVRLTDPEGQPVKGIKVSSTPL